MPIPPQFDALITQLYQELEQTEQDAREGLNLLGDIMSRFPNNTLLIQFFAYFNTSLFFVENSRIRIDNMMKQLFSVNLSVEKTQEIGEDLATLLGIL